MMKIAILVFISTGLCNAIVYDRYTGEEASDDLLSSYDANGYTSTCTMDISPCDETEYRRVDGSCNSLNNPVRGTYFEPQRRMLPSEYYNGSYSRKAADGSDLALPRAVRTTLLCEGKSSHPNFTQAMPGYSIFGFGDYGSIHDIVYFLVNKTDCCTPEGMKSNDCTPNIIPDDDPVLRFSDIRCLNLTRPRGYADYGCTNDTEPSPVEQATGVLDLSPIYDIRGQGDSGIRSYDGGKLTVEMDENGIIWPPNGDGFCLANQPGETRCFANYPTNIVSVMLLSIWYMRQHNYFATELAAVNPSWDDETLFQVARDINIAFHQRVYFYEHLPPLLGYQNMVDNGIISEDGCLRETYDETTYPEVSVEFTHGCRWFHTIQEGSMFLYDADGNFLKSYPYTNVTMRPGFLGVDDHIVTCTQHLFRQAAAAIDHEVDPEISESGLPYIQRSVDIVTSDLHKSRLLGLAPYIDYVENRTGDTITCFEDLEKYMDKERVEQMKKVYVDVKDIDYLAGMWSEKMVEGGEVPAILAFVLFDFYKKNIASDRHWHERPNRPHAFTEEQILEINKSRLSLLMCTNADGVSEVQLNAFLRISDDNPLGPCSEIPSIDFTKWADSSCK